MNQTVSLICDIVVVCIVLWCVISAARKGFLRTVVQMVAYTLVITGAIFLSRASAPIIYERIVEPMFLSGAQQEKTNALLVEKENSRQVIMVEAKVSENDDESSDSEYETDKKQDNIPDLSGIKIAGVDLGELNLDGIDLSALKKLDLSSVNISNLDLSDLYELGLPEDLVKDLADQTVRPVMEGAIGTICFAFLFAVGSMLSNILLKALGIIRYVPIIGKLNAMLGACIGLIEGVLIVGITAILLGAILKLSPAGIGYLNMDVIDGTYLLKQFFV